MNGWLQTLLPWKEVIGGVFGTLSAGTAILLAILKQRRAPDATFTEQANVGPRPNIVRLCPDDRELIGDAREAATDLARAIRHLTGATEDNTGATEGNTAALKRRGGRP